MTAGHNHGLRLTRGFLTAMAFAAAMFLSASASAATPNLEGFWWPGRAASGARMPELTSKLPA